MTDQVILVISTCPDDAVAQDLSRTLVIERLVTCVNRVSQVRSTYLWADRLEDQPETLLIMKTTSGRLAELEARLKALHPYEVPEWLVIPVAGGNERYLDWVRQGVVSKDK